MASSLNMRQRKKTDSDGLALPSARTSNYRYSKVQSNKTFGDIGELPNLQIIGALTFFALIVRLLRLSNPHEVVFDEVHFGGFATKYINGQFFMDVHPPLGKLLFAAAGLLGGYNSTFYFENIGDDYLASHVPFVTMRLLPAMLGVLLVPVSYITLRNFGASNTSAVLSALMLTLENGFITQSRLILLDSGLIFFTGLTVMMWTDFLTNQETPFTFNWWYPLVMTGVSLGLAGSVKWVGLFLIATIGMSTLINLWSVLGDLRVSPRQFVDHFFARALCLIVIPFSLYAFLFQVHFWALPNKGGGSGFMSPEFQSTLRGNEIPNTYSDVAFGSKIHIRHHATNGGYLHSHAHDYPDGSKQQQMTVYPFKDENGEFLLLPGLVQHNETVTEPNVTGLKYVKNGDVVRLVHIKTGKKVHSHGVKAPVTMNEHHWEVSGYGSEGFTGDTNDNWIIRIADKKIDDDEPVPITAINTKIRFIHVNNRRCGMFSHDVKLPAWGFEQQEVTCAENNRRAGCVWLIEANENDYLPKDAKRVNFKRPGFWRKFKELHGTMWSVNQGLTGKHPYESRPIEWPILNRGILFWTEKNGGPRQIYLLGNPIVWWVSTLAVLSCLTLLGSGVLLLKRSVPILHDIHMYKAWTAAIIVVSGWFLHYFPFFLMKRQLFLHHYFPALYFAILSVGVLFELLTHRLPRPTRVMMAGVLLAMVFLVYLDFSPITYGNMMHKNHCNRLKWGKHWDWTCVTSPEDEHDIPAQSESAGEWDW
ncbi:Dolichyl-phosphate-mannose-protein mannosyltransferase-domain-containing protein [Chytriomyces sp. MP71]|nr:Dolichyl-phosphate-mannose-protein mannosyltransferase-domain-containing protein [Chytriomyces sp. MP71]